MPMLGTMGAQTHCVPQLRTGNGPGEDPRDGLTRVLSGFGLLSAREGIPTVTAYTPSYRYYRPVPKEFPARDLWGLMWLLVRGLLSVVTVLVVIAPVEFVRDFALTRILLAVGLMDLRLTIEAAMIVGAALVGSAAWAFEAVYDARLYSALMATRVKRDQEQVAIRFTQASRAERAWNS